LVADYAIVMVVQGRKRSESILLSPAKPALEGTPGREEAREALRKNKVRLADMPPLEAAGMVLGMREPAWHTPRVTWGTDGGGETAARARPGRSGPRASARLPRGTAGLPRARRRHPSPPRPIAVLAPGVPIEDVIARPTAIRRPVTLSVAATDVAGAPTTAWSAFHDASAHDVTGRGHCRIG
jgi:hypothetical protein